MLACYHQSFPQRAQRLRLTRITNSAGVVRDCAGGCQKIFNSAPNSSKFLQMAAMLEQDRMMYSFNGFQLDPHKRLLVRNGQAVQLSSKAFDLLLALIESGGREITKEELMGRVWTDQIVEDANLTVTMSHLRKALGEKAGEHRFIVTIPGRGYRFVGELARSGAIVEERSISKIVIEEAEFGDEPNITPVIQAEVLVPSSGYADLEKARAEHVAPMKALTSGRGNAARGRRWLYGGLVVVGLSVIGFGIWTFSSRLKTRDALPFVQARNQQLTTKGNLGNAAISSDGKFYAYCVFERGEYKESLWLGQVGGSNDLQLRPPAEVTFGGIAFSADGKTLYFDQSSPEQSQRGLFKVPVLGGVAEKLSDEIQSNFAIAPDGKQIAFFRNDTERNTSVLVIANLDGAEQRALSTRPLDKAFVARPAWSPDGSLLAFSAITDSVTESRELFVLRLADGRLEQLPALAWARISNLVWAGDARGLIVVATDKNGIIRHLWQVGYPSGIAHLLSPDTDTYGVALSISADGETILAVQVRRESNLWIGPASDLTQARQVSFSSMNGVYGWNGFDWTPDDRIIFAAGTDNSLGLYSMDASGGQLKQLTSGGFFDRRPTITMDGRFIVFQSNRSGNDEIWRANIDGGDLRQLTTGGGNSMPHTAPDSKSVVYISTRAGKSFISRVPIEGGNAVKVADDVFSNPRVSPDGKYIACAYKANPNTSEQLAILKFEDGTPVKLFDVPRSAALNDGLRWTPDGKALCYRDYANGVWRQPVAGGLPKRLEGLPEEKGYIYGWSHDGKLFAFTRGREISDAVLIRKPN